MALSLESIHQPLTEFFLNQFHTDVGSPIQFRFDKFGSVLSEEDFIDPSHPELGYLRALAMEKFSDLVNHIPIDTGDGINIVLSTDSIDTTYFFRLLTSSIPYIPTETSDDTTQAIINAFSVVKADSLKIWNSVKAESISGLMLQYKPSLATPESWYDKSKNEVWTSHSFQINETSSETDPSPSNHLWRLKLNDAVMLQALQLPKAETDAQNLPQLNIAARILELHANPSEMVMPKGTAQVARSFVAVEPAQNIRTATADAVFDNENVALHATYLQQFRTLDVSKRLLVNQYLGNEAPTQAVKTRSVSISFDYCLVNIRRPWYVDAFINEKSWCVPSVPKGQVTAIGLAGSLPLMPIGFVAIRNLSIEANWANEDVANASVATHFGPFKVTADIVNNKLTHPGLQIISWVLQKMPDLPPNDAANYDMQNQQDVLADLAKKRLEFLALRDEFSNILKHIEDFQNADGSPVDRATLTLQQEKVVEAINAMEQEAKRCSQDATQCNLTSFETGSFTKPLLKPDPRIRVPSLMAAGLLGSNAVPPGFTVTIGERLDPPRGDLIAHVARQNPLPDSFAQEGSTITIDYFWPGETPPHLSKGKIFTVNFP